jgi:hypothetical protein
MESVRESIMMCKEKVKPNQPVERSLDGSKLNALKKDINIELVTFKDNHVGTTAANEVSTCDIFVSINDINKPMKPRCRHNHCVTKS